MTDGDGTQRSIQPSVTPVGRSSPARAEAGRRGGALGTRAHIQETLDRARAAIRAARGYAATTQSVLARAEDVVGASSRAVQASVALRAELRESVTAYVRHLKSEGLPSERVLVLVKTAVRDATLAELDAWEARELMEDVVRWSVEAYYPAA